MNLVDKIGSRTKQKKTLIYLSEYLILTGESSSITDENSF